MKIFGDLIRAKREEKEMLQRHLAAELDIDVAYLSKMERGEKTAKREHLKPMAKILGLNLQEITALYLAEQLYNIVEDEEQAMDALKLAEAEVKYQKTTKMK